MATKINSKTVYATVGNFTRSGTAVTLRFQARKGDGSAVYDYFVNGAYYTTVGDQAAGYTYYTVNGWFQRDRSSCTPREAYVDIVLVFDQQNVQGLNVNAGNTDKYDPVYTLSTATEERPIEQHPNFKCSWTYNLYELVVLGGTPSAVPAWAATDTNPAAIHANYLWAHTPPSSPDAEHEYVCVQAATDFGMDSYMIPRPVVTSTIYYKTRAISNSDLVHVGELKAPPETYIYGSSASQWLVTSSDVSEATDELMAVTTTYRYCKEGWKTKVYPLAT